jgi:hypothetical protein
MLKWGWFQTVQFRQGRSALFHQEKQNQLFFIIKEAKSSMQS